MEPFSLPGIKYFRTIIDAETSGRLDAIIVAQTGVLAIFNAPGPSFISTIRWNHHVSQRMSFTL